MRSVESRIESLKTQDYVRAFRVIQLTDNERKMLSINLAAPRHAITAQRMAIAMGFANHKGANRHYGLLAGKICRELDVAPKQKVSVLVSFEKPFGSGWKWILRKPVVAALRYLRITIAPEWRLPEEPPIDLELPRFGGQVVVLDL